MSSEVWKSNKAQTTNQFVKKIQQSGLHLQCERTVHVYCSDRPGRQHRVCPCLSSQPALLLMRLTFGRLSVNLLVMQRELLHTTCLNYVSPYKNMVPVITAINMFGLQWKPHLDYTEIKAKTHTHTHTHVCILYPGEDFYWLNSPCLTLTLTQNVLT